MGQRSRRSQSVQGLELRRDLDLILSKKECYWGEGTEKRTKVG